MVQSTMWRRLLSSSSLVLPISLASCSLNSALLCENEKKDVKEEENIVGGLFLNKASSDILKDRFGVEWKGQDGKEKKSALLFGVSTDFVEKLDLPVGSDLKFKLKSFVVGEKHPAAVITLESRKETEKLMEEISVFVTADDIKVDSRTLDVTTINKLGLLEEPIELTGVICSHRYDYEISKCVGEDGEPKECGFCLFMRAGPCGDQFRAWEDCLAKSKENGEDFIEKCGTETVNLRDCMNQNPEYYAVLNDNDDDKNENETTENETK